MCRASVPCQCAVLQECALSASGRLGSAVSSRPGRVSVVLACVPPPWSCPVRSASGEPQGCGVAPPLPLVALVSWRARPCVLARCRGALGVSVVLVFAAPRLRSAGARARVSLVAGTRPDRAKRLPLTQLSAGKRPTRPLYSAGAAVLLSARRSSPPKVCRLRLPLRGSALWRCGSSPRPACGGSAPQWRASPAQPFQAGAGIVHNFVDKKLQKIVGDMK